eukprot:TRINITY_DN42030_c0_g1_i1.p1 TRINITY_DN42030_c0_g1~~TRINITY_DN42030_c0_g1_i1.p1  ORF type:complete len:789 (-),score=128.60 TRINITY_DN42030_c0_g1_i1:108-2474(-)
MSVAERFVDGVRVGSQVGSASCTKTMNLLRASDDRSWVSAGQNVAAGFTAAAVGVVVGVPCTVIGGAVGAVVGGAEQAKSAVRDAAEDAKLGRERTALRSAASTASSAASMSEHVIPLLYALLEAHILKAMTEDEAWGVAVAFVAEHSESPRGPQFIESVRIRTCEVYWYTRLRRCYQAVPAEQIRDTARQLVARGEIDVFVSAMIACGGTPLRDWLREIGTGPPEDLAGMTKELLTSRLDLQWRRDREAMAESLKRRFPDGERGSACAERYFSLLDSFHQELTMLSFWKAWRVLLHGPLPKQFQGRNFEEVSSAVFLDEFRNFLGDLPSFFDGSAEVADAWVVGGEHVKSGGRLIEAIAKAKAPLSPTESAPSEGLHVLIEVLTAKSLKAPEYRFGDLTYSLLRGKPKLRPYVQVCIGAERRVTRTVEAVGDSAKFGEALILPPEDGSEESFKNFTLEVAVYDGRLLQSIVRGDPLIGIGMLELHEVGLGSSRIHVVHLMRNGRTSGNVTVRVGAAAPRAAYNVLATRTSRPLADVVRALAEVLVQPSGVDALLRCRPDGLVTSSGKQDEIGLRRALQSWIVRLYRLAQGLSGALDDDGVTTRLKGLMRSLGQIVAASAQDRRSAAEVQQLTTCWISAVLVSMCGGSVAAPSHTDNAWLSRLFEQRTAEPVASSPPAPNAQELLRGMGVTLPEEVAERVATALLARLVEAEETGEEEMFTGSALVQNGRVASGLGAVFRKGPHGDVAHVFLYDLELIREWQSMKGWDPLTSETLDEADILPLGDAAA